MSFFLHFPASSNRRAEGLPPTPVIGPVKLLEEVLDAARTTAEIG